MLDLPETSSARRQVAVSERYSRTINQPDPKNIWNGLSVEQKLAATKSLTVYCEPVELYNKIRSHEEKYHVGRIFTFQGPSGIDWNGNHYVLVKFMLPQHEKLAVETTYDKYFLCILASAENPISLSKLNESTLPLEVASNESLGGERSLSGKVSLKFLYDLLKISSDSPLQDRTEIHFSTEFRSCNLKYCLQQYSRTKSRTISIRDSDNAEVEGVLKKVEISTSFEEFGAAREPPPCRRRKRNEEASSSSSLPHINWLPGNVLFQYRYYHDMLQKTEVTENFACAICLVKCVNYQGLKYHLIASHELFSFEFSESEEFPTVSLSVKNPNWRQQLIDPKLDTFMHCAKKPKRRKLNTLYHARNHARNYADELFLDVELRIGDPRQLQLENVVYDPLISGYGLPAMQQLDPQDPQEVSNAIAHLRSILTNQNNEIHTTLDVDHEHVTNTTSHPCQGSVPSISNQNKTSGVLEVSQEEVLNAIVLHTGQDCVLSISDQDGTCGVLEVNHQEVSNAIVLHTDQDCLPSISDQNGTCGVLEVNHEEVLNAIVLHTSQECVPPISNQDGTCGVLEVNHEEVSNAIVLQTSQDCVPPIFDQDETCRVLEVDHEEVSNAIVLHKVQDSIPPISDQGGIGGVLEVDHDEVSNAIVLHTSQDCVPAISNHDNGVRVGLEEGVSNATILHTDQDCVSPIFNHDNGTHAALEDDVSNAIILHPTLDPVSSIAMQEGGTSSMPQVEEKEKFLIELFDPNLIARWKRRTFYHSHTYQKLELLGISGEQKRLQTMWDSFVKKHRVLADGHVNWAYEAFTKYHCAELAESTSLAW
ncbi:hypothetical protein VNO80_15784 [Phaseolus coccineus]|uniref:Polycomb protein VEFS-Box domain-containing protein n=1 Tax=Phaseolus coccineus TaxID=3886 RepID=A0AAN9R2L4_PHACN